jgi:hypothetical protein
MSDARTVAQPLVSKIAALLLTLAVLTACVQQQTQPPPLTLPPQRDCPAYPVETIAGLESQNQALESKLAVATAKIAGLEKKIVDQDIRILQKTALVNELQRRVSSQQKLLDNAITEVVRTKSKLRSNESKAEAASTIAEAEIAVKSMKNRMADTDLEGLEAFSKATQLLKLSTVEFKAQNYGGALYLAVQSKHQVSIGRLRIQVRDESTPVSGEVAFDPPLPLTLTKNTNLRSGPDFNHPVLATLTPGSAIVGYSYKESWIRVDTPAGMSGWVHQSLVRAR